MWLEPKNWRSMSKWQVGEFKRGDPGVMDPRGPGPVVLNNLKSCPCMFIPQSNLVNVWILSDDFYHNVMILLPSHILFCTCAEIKSAFSNKEAVQKEVTAAISQKATLGCEVSDLRTEVRWYKDSKLLTPTKTLHTEVKGKGRQLVIDSIEKKDAGEYICEAGTEKVVFRINVAGR